MTFAVGTVEGGTHAGWRRVREKPTPWMCRNGCSHEPVRAYLTHCPVCKAARPKE